MKVTLLLNEIEEVACRWFSYIIKSIKGLDKQPFYRSIFNFHFMSFMIFKLYTSYQKKEFFFFTLKHKMMDIEDDNIDMDNVFHKPLFHLHRKDKR